MALLERVAACEACEDDVARLRALAEMVRDTADCAIGYEAAEALLAGMDEFSAEYESHLLHGACRAGVGQSVPCETLCPAHVDAPGYIGARGRAGDYAGAVNLVRKDNPFPTACALRVRAPVRGRGAAAPLVDAPVNIRGIKRFAVDQAPADSGGTPAPRSVDTARNGGRGGRRPERADLRVLPARSWGIA